MEQLTAQSCEDFLAALASKAPVPGGGGAAALVGATGIALGNMVGNLTVGKKKYAAVDAELRELNAQADALRRWLLSLVTADAEVFEPLSRAYSLPKATPEEQAHKAEVMAAALEAAVAVPLQILDACAEAVAMLEVYAEKGSVLALSDAGCGAVFCKAAMQAACMNVWINTKSMADRVQAEALNARCDALLNDYCPRADAIYARVAAKLKG